MAASHDIGEIRRKGWRYAARRSWQRHWQLYLLILPPLAYFAIFKYLPMINAVIAFKDYNVVAGVWGSPWAGLKHFNNFFGNPVFWQLIRNTFTLSAYYILASFPIPIILALALNEVRLRLLDGHVEIETP